jgi:SAM-dependent methyltransferase
MRPAGRPLIPGTEGYAEQAEVLIARYEVETFEDKHRAELHLLPRTPVQALDVGAGTGADAAWLAEQGHTVVAAEPTAAFRAAGQTLHPRAAIHWVDDSLPLLATVRAEGQRFGLILLSAVWMHLDAPERTLAMASLRSLLAPGGVLILSLRHGPVPAGRRMFDVSADETIALARGHGLLCVLNVHVDSTHTVNRAAGVTWSRLGFHWAAPYGGAQP